MCAAAGPGTRESTLLDLANTVEQIDAIALAGGSAFGLEAGAGIQAWLAEQGRGFNVRGATHPHRARRHHFRSAERRRQAMGPLRAVSRTRLQPPPQTLPPASRLGSVGAGLGATTAMLKGGLGSASAITSGGVRVAALAVVNAIGSVSIGDGPWFWAAPFELNNEFGGRRLAPMRSHPDMLAMRLKGRCRSPPPIENTTLAVVVTDAILSEAASETTCDHGSNWPSRARSIPFTAPLDGDIVFAAATCDKPIDPMAGLTELGMLAANAVTRAIPRGVYAANSTAISPTRCRRGATNSRS